MTLYPFHIAGLREALAKDGENFRYSTVVWSAIKKSAKSTIAAAVALWFAWQKPWSSIKIIANDLKQADSRVFYYIRRSLELNPAMRSLVRIVNYRIELPNHSYIEAIPIDPKGEAGGGDDLVIYSEIWGWNNKAALKMWTETTLSPLKYGKSIRWAETYSGFSSESPVLEQLYESGVTNGQCIDAENEFYRNDRLLCIWNTKPSTPWQTEEYYRQEATSLTDVEFNRVHKNQWGSSTSSFVPSEWYDNCLHALPAYERLESWIIALDAAVSGDCFGLVAITRKDGITIVRHVRKWTPPPGGTIQYFAPIGTPPEKDESPAGELRRLCDRHSVVKVVFDPYQLHSFCSQMKEELVVFFDPFPQQTQRLLADKTLRDTIRERQLWHDGNMDLREHVLNANAKNEGETDKLRIVKKKDSLKIDLAVCLSMANFAGIQLNIG
jgi:phage terminase large subunit-like protein